MASPRRLKTRATLQRLKSSATVNAAGHIVEPTAANWESYAKRWCSVEYRAGREALTGKQLTEASLPVLVFHSDPLTRALTTKNRAQVGSRTFNFAAPPVDIADEKWKVEVPATEAP